MTVSFRPARREEVGLLIGLAGASGAGKSFSALRLARGLAGDKPFCVIDTEARRMLHYADRFQPWEHAELRPPFRPATYAEAIKTADEAGYPVIVVDSASHEWAGDGGLLDWHEEEFQRMGGREAVKITAWIKPKMEHKRFVSQLLQVRSHLILCFRAEEKVEIIDDPAKPGKKKVVPKRSVSGFEGWQPICEKSLPYELTLSLLLTPDAPGIPKPIKLQEQHRPFLPLDTPISEQTGVELARWAAGEKIEPSEDEQTARRLTDRALELADQLGTRDQVMSAIATNRRRAGSNLKPHIAWLEKAVDAADQKVGDGEPTEAELATAGDAATADLPF